MAEPCRFGLPRTTLQDKVRYLPLFDTVKHGLTPIHQTDEEYVDQKIDRMSNSEFLAALSEAIEELRNEP